MDRVFPLVSLARLERENISFIQNRKSGEGEGANRAKYRIWKREKSD